MCSSAADTPAADVDPVKAKVMYAVQQALATSAFGDVMGVPAWKTLPSWYLVAADDPRTGRPDLGAADRAARGRWGLAGREHQRRTR